MQHNNFVIVEFAFGSTIVKLENNKKINLKKAGQFNSNLILGKPYGITCEILSENELRVMSSDELNDEYISFNEENGANNQDICDDRESQILTHEEINKLKEKMENGELHGKEVIDCLISNNKSFEKRTEFSKAKYVKRKKKKFMKIVKFLKPTYESLCQMMFKKSAQKILEMRIDSLAYLLNISNIYPGSKVLIADDTNGLLTGAVLERMNGDGLVVSLYEGQTREFDLLKYFNFNSEQKSILHSLPWFRFKAHEMNEETNPAKERKINAIEKVLHTRNILYGGNFDALIIASKFSPLSVLNVLLPFVGGARPVAIFHAYSEPLLDVFDSMRNNSSDFIDTQLVESNLVEYQVLPQRTHPLNNQFSSGGFVISSLRVINE
jgi:tRNA (adenine-N(1)-)-methyltransferase non-catalytic subunit